jgi:hypothetical protein
MTLRRSLLTLCAGALVLGCATGNGHRAYPDDRYWYERSRGDDYYWYERSRRSDRYLAEEQARERNRLERSQERRRGNLLERQEDRREDLQESGDWKRRNVRNQRAVRQQQQGRFKRERRALDEQHDREWDDD